MCISGNVSLPLSLPCLLLSPHSPLSLSPLHAELMENVEQQSHSCPPGPGEGSPRQGSENHNDENHVVLLAFLELFIDRMI